MNFLPHILKFGKAITFAARGLRGETNIDARRVGVSSLVNEHFGAAFILAARSGEAGGFATTQNERQ